MHILEYQILQLLRFERRIASIENGMVATSASSGMSAIYLAVMNMVESGDEIVSSSGLYGGTYTLMRNLKSIGVKVHFLENINPDTLKSVINKNKIGFCRNYWKSKT